jgi:hypothetical protein
MKKTKELKKIKEKNQKERKNIFTKKEKNIIIAEDYNLSKVNYKLIYEREEKSMYNKEVLKEVKKLSKKYNKKEKMILEMFKIGLNNGYSVNEIKTMIEEFENNDNCY